MRGGGEGAYGMSEVLYSGLKNKIWGIKMKNSAALPEIGKHAKIIVFGLVKPMEYDPLKDLIGIVKVKKQLDVEELIDFRGFDDAGEHLEF